MSEAIIASFQTQLSNVLETILKTAIYEITKLVENSLLEEVGRGKQEMQVLRLRLQQSELKLKEKELETSGRGKCADCGGIAISILGEGHAVKEEAVEWSSCDQGQGEVDREILSPTPEKQFKVIQVEGVQATDIVKTETITDSSGPQDIESRVTHSFLGDKQASDQDSLSVLSDCKQSDAVVKQVETKNLKGGMSNQGSNDQASYNSGSIRTQPGPEFITKDHTKPRSSQLRTGTNMQPSAEPPNITHRAGPSDSLPVRQEMVVPYPQWIEKEHEACSDNVNPPKVNRPLVCIAPKLLPSRRQMEGVIMLSHNDVVRKHSLGLAQQEVVSASSLATAEVDKGTASLYKTAATRPAQPHHHQRVYAGGGKRFGALQLGGRGNAQMASFKTHLSDHYAAKVPYSCLQCGKWFSHPCHLKEHQLTHSGERPFCCTHCGRSFTKLSNLKAHCRVHTGERPYTCSDCGKRFTQNCNLKRHQRIHTAHS